MRPSVWVAKHGVTATMRRQRKPCGGYLNFKTGKPRYYRVTLKRGRLVLAYDHTEEFASPHLRHPSYFLSLLLDNYVDCRRTGWDNWGRYVKLTGSEDTPEIRRTFRLTLALAKGVARFVGGDLKKLTRDRQWYEYSE